MKRSEINNAIKKAKERFENFLKEINSLSGSKEKLSTHEYALTEKDLTEKEFFKYFDQLFYSLLKSEILFEAGNKHFVRSIKRSA